MKRFNKLLCFMVVFIGTMAVLYNVAFAKDFSNWEIKSSMAEKINSFGTVYINNKIYILGGQNESKNAIDKLQVYDIDSDTWIEKSSMPTPRFSMGVAYVNGKIYTIGGCKGTYTNITNVNEVYDPVTDTWETKRSIPIALASFATVVFDGKIYVIGGYKDYSAEKTLYVYDPVSDTWTTKTSMPTARKGVTAVVANNLIYVFGGWTGTTTYSIVEAYDPLADKWTTVAPMTEAKAHAFPLQIDSDIYLFGGLNNNTSSATNRIEKYNYESNSWSVVGTLPDDRGALGAAYIKNKVYIVGGLDYSKGVMYDSVYSNTGVPQQTNQLKLVLEVNQEKQLSVSNELSDNSEMDWVSSEPSIATVDANGMVKALKPGNTIITCTSKDKSYTESINVLVVDLEYQLAVDLSIGGTCRLTIDDLTNTTYVTWSSCDPTIATVSAKGKVTAVSEGLTYIIAIDKDGNEIGRIYVRVRL